MPYAPLCYPSSIAAAPTSHAYMYMCVCVGPSQANAGPGPRQQRMVRMDADADDMCARCGMYGPSSLSGDNWCEECNASEEDTSEDDAEEHW